MSDDETFTLPDSPHISYVPFHTSEGKTAQFPHWTGTVEEAAELLASTPSGPARRLLKSLTFGLFYGGGSNFLESHLVDRGEKY